MSDGAKGGASITDMAGRLGLDYKVIQTYLWQSGTLRWQGAKSIITRRLRSVKSARKQADRDRLVEDTKEQVDYLCYAAKELQTRWDKVKSLD